MIYRQWQIEVVSSCQPAKHQGYPIGFQPIPSPQTDTQNQFDGNPSLSHCGQWWISIHVPSRLFTWRINPCSLMLNVSWLKARKWSLYIILRREISLFSIKENDNLVLSVTCLASGIFLIDFQSKQEGVTSDKHLSNDWEIQHASVMWLFTFCAWYPGRPEAPRQHLAWGERRREQSLSQHVCNKVPSRKKTVLPGEKEVMAAPNPVQPQLYKGIVKQVRWNGSYFRNNSEKWSFSQCKIYHVQASLI